MADTKNPFITDEKKINEVKDAGKALNFSEVKDPQRKYEIGALGSTFGAGVYGGMKLGDRSDVRAALTNGGIVDGPFVSLDGNYNLLQGNLGPVKPYLGVGAFGGAGPDAAAAGVKLNVGTEISDRVNVRLGVGPAVVVPYGDNLSPDTIKGVVADFSVGVKF